MEKKFENYFKLLRYSIENQLYIPIEIEKMNWEGLYSFAMQQAISAVVFGVIERLGNKNTNILRDLLFNWIGDVELIKQRNQLMNKRCVELVEQLHNDGFDCCVLKGQGNASMYPNPYCRTPGDIDIWVRPGDQLKAKDERLEKKDFISYAKKLDTNIEVRYYHVEYNWKDVPVELHFTPGIMNNPWYNRRLQQWYWKMADGGWQMAELPEGVGTIPVPTKEFNIVFQLAHMMHHFFDEGIGLRQMIDYYYLLHSEKDDVRSKKSDVRETLKYLNLYKFAGAVMYIMKEVLGLEEKLLIVPVDERRGKTLLREIQKGGNFGHSSGLAQNNAAKKYIQKTWRNMQLVKEYPAEALCEPIFRTWHFFWRLVHRRNVSV